VGGRAGGREGERQRFATGKPRGGEGAGREDGARGMCEPILFSLRSFSFSLSRGERRALFRPF